MSINWKTQQITLKNIFGYLKFIKIIFTNVWKFYKIEQKSVIWLEFFTWIISVFVIQYI